jgi:hypothetical protein
MNDGTEVLHLFTADGIAKITSIYFHSANNLSNSAKVI